MAETPGESSNSRDDLTAIFDTLADWEKQLQHIELPEPSNVGDEFEGPSP